MVKNDNPGSICPTCQTPVDSLSQCRCPTSTQPSANLVAQAEAVFESYLAARIVRARRDLTAAKIALLRDPRNRDRMDALRRAEAEAEQLQAQLIEQTRKATQAQLRNSHPTLADALGNSASTGETTPTEARPARLSQTKRDCPRCGRQLAGDAAACGCGHTFARDATHLTAQFLSEAELLALRPRK